MTDVEWLSLDEAAARLKISRESARRIALRKRWDKRPGNDGRCGSAFRSSGYTAAIP